MSRRTAVLVVIGGLLALASPAAAQTAGPATFVRAIGGSTSLALYPAGLKIYSNAPAYIAVRVSARTSSVEAYGARHQFAAVAVRDVRGGRPGIDCFIDAHPVIGPSFVSDFVRGGLEYHGLLLQYAKFFFLRGASRASACTTAPAAAPAVPYATSTGGSAQLVFDCLVRSCRGSFVTFGGASNCSGAVSIPGGGSGCLPSLHGSFTMTGGLRLTFKIKLLGRSASTTFIATVVNGKRIALSRLIALPPPPATPPRPAKTTVSASCTGAAAGGQVTVSGSLRPGGRAPVVLSFNGPSGASSVLTTTAGADGRYSAPFTPMQAGAWTVTAGFNGDRTRRASTSSPCGFAVS